MKTPLKVHFKTISVAYEKKEVKCLTGANSNTSKIMPLKQEISLKPPLDYTHEHPVFGLRLWDTANTWMFMSKKKKKKN